VNKLSLILFLLIFTCTEGRRLKKIIEGVNKMDSDIFPEVVSIKIPALGIYNDREPGRFIIVSMGGSIYRGHFENGEIKTTEIESVRFEAPCKQLFFDAQRQIIYGYGVRDFHAIDLSTKQYRKTIVSFKGNDKILFAALLREEPDIHFLIQTSYTGWTDKDSYDIYTIYDFNKDTAISKSDKFFGGGMLYPIRPNYLLFQKWNNSNPTEWYFTDNTLTKKETNDFTKALSAKDIGTWDNDVNLAHQILIGTVRTTGDYFIIRWSPDYSDFSFNPFTFHKPKDRSIQEHFEISPDGNWVKGISKSTDYDIRDDKVIFYHANEKYPSGLSIAVHGWESYLSQYYPGAFVETKEWGMVYIDIFKGMDGVLFVYKMNDVLTQIAQQAKEMVE
jgi:hypothetical protein